MKEGQMGEWGSALVEAWTELTFWQSTLVFLSMVVRAIGTALLIGIPAGIILAALRRLSGPVIAALGLLQTFPSLALLGLLIPVLGIGQTAAIFLAVVYSLFPIVMNTCVGINQVPLHIRDTALGMGMTRLQVLWNVSLPLALPIILAGVRTGVVYAIGIVTVCALAGAGGLGDYIVRGLTRSDDLLIFTGAIPILALTLLVFGGLGGLAWLARRSHKLGLTLGGGLILLLAGYAQVEWLRPLFQPRKDVIRLVGKNFTEGRVLTEIMKQMLEAHTRVPVEVKQNVTSSLMIKGINNGDLDIYAEYMGNLLTNKDALDMPIPEDKSTITDIVRKEMRKRRHLVVLESFGFNNPFTFCLKKDVALSHNLKTISDLARAPNLRIVVDLDFTDRPDGWKNMVKRYDLHLPEPQRVELSFRYKVLLKDQADIALGYATDWEIDAYDLAMLDDDLGYFPSYNAAPVVREETLARHPEIATVLNRLHGVLDEKTMRGLNFRVERAKRPEVEVVRAVREFLERRGLLKKEK